MRIGIVALLQESNTFAPGQTTLADFEADLLLCGDEVRQKMADAPHEIGGFFAGLTQFRLEPVPVFAARAIPWGPINSPTYDTLLQRLFDELDAASPLDGLLVAAHGATVSEQFPDVDGHWLSELRQRVGPKMPIIGTLDLHANLSTKIVESTDALIAYRTNPHLDQRERGIEAAHLMKRVLDGTVQPRQAAAFLPLSIGMECQLTSESPCLELFREVDKLLEQPDVVGASALLGFPYADVREMGAAILIASRRSVDAAQSKANELAGWVWERRDKFFQLPTSIAAALSRASNSSGPVCLLDVGDNIGGGAPGDATHLTHAIRERQIGPALVCLHDPEAVEHAMQFAVGASIDATIGGKSCALVGQPLCGTFRVKGKFDGKFKERQPRHGGFKEFDQGDTVVLETRDRLTLIVNSRRTPPYSLAQITHCGIEPADFQIIVAKGVHAPVAAYCEVCRELIRVNTPGVTTAEIAQLKYVHRRVPMFPLEGHTSWNPGIDNRI